MLNFILSLFVTTAFAQTCPAAPYGETQIQNYQTVSVCHTNYLTQYSETYHDPIVVNWVLTKEELANNCLKRSTFETDPELNGNDVSPYAYRNSGYDKGHLSPAEDNVFSQKTENESFYMSNMTPQIPQFNRNGWKWFEELERKYAYQYGKVVIWSGTIFENDNSFNGVRVPTKFWKIIYIPSINKVISILAPNEPIKGDDILTFLSTPDEIEMKAGVIIPLPESVDKNQMGDDDDINVSNSDIQKAKSCSISR